MVTKDRYAVPGGPELYHEVHGSGPPLVLLPGGILTIEASFGPLLPMLAADRQVIAVELQGHGRTTDVEREPTLAHYADDVAALLGHLDVERADVFGFSLGGLTALTLALRRPALVRKLVVASIDHRPGQVDPEDPPPMEAADDPRMPTAQDFEEMRADHRRVAPDPDHFDEFFARTSAMVQSLTGWTDDELRSVASPTLVIVGDQDFMPVRHALQMSQLIPRAQLAVLPGTTHMGVSRSPRRLAALLGPFLDTDGDPARPEGDRS